MLLVLLITPNKLPRPISAHALADLSLCNLQLDPSYKYKDGILKVLDCVQQLQTVAVKIMQIISELNVLLDMISPEKCVKKTFISMPSKLDVKSCNVLLSLNTFMYNNVTVCISF
ncbi:hypothetical protein CHS0354_037383 [Potamilus streckersoni]|uniref:Uncharacterized protein n=1 Tax=Potamilus streckersoni TaxID=2493646 RepID=A0AAE0RR56_9BIVA|nr:hypothetical protein CHS0354_037383 [Potamilus streckersoni]